MKEAGKKPIIMSKVSEVLQKIDESPGAFAERLMQAFRMYTPFDPEAAENLCMVNTTFVVQSYADIRKKLQKQDSFAGVNSSELLEITPKVYANRDVDQKQEEKRRIKKKTDLLAAALAESACLPACGRAPPPSPLPGAFPAEPLINTGGLAEAAAGGEARASPEKPAPPSGLPSAFVTVCWLRCPAPFEAAIMRNLPPGNLQVIFPVTALTIAFSAIALGFTCAMFATMLFTPDVFPLQLESRVLAILDRWNNSQLAAMGKWNISQQEYPGLPPAA
ncbi:uncharacterized protein LOC132588946 [Heteronotia binoei]|uniref:uncharacterized protein LOC132588946 n=1 Tax=Heteronotia binoei TaxID=13085 RepID=UPI002930E45F|nr:uncharacterized protein LOC132588946 [Heteronotia binoei]